MAWLRATIDVLLDYLSCSPCSTARWHTREAVATLVHILNKRIQVGLGNDLCQGPTLACIVLRSQTGYRIPLLVQATSVDAFVNLRNIPELKIEGLVLTELKIELKIECHWPCPGRVVHKLPVSLTLLRYTFSIMSHCPGGVCQTLRRCWSKNSVESTTRNPYFGPETCRP